MPGSSATASATVEAAYNTFESQSLEADPTADGADEEGDRASNEVENPNRPRGIKFVVLFVCILLGDFVIGYVDTSCVETLTPVITDDFHATADVAWYGIAYLLASCATVLIYGQLYSYFSMRFVFMTSSLIFSLGSVVSAMAVSSTMLILGRAVSGLGASGIFAGGSIIVASTTPLKQRPMYQAACGGVESVALAFGPVLGGAIAYHTSWRVAIYIIIPIGVAMLLAVYAYVDEFEQPEDAHLSKIEKFKRLDLVGFALYVPMTVCFTLGLQWAGVEYSWSDWRVVILLVLAAILLLAFLVTEHRTGDSSMFPLSMLRQRSVTLSCCFCFCNSAALFALEFYLPIYFQAVRRASVGASGALTLSTAVPIGLTILAAGPVTSFLGYYNPVMISGSILMLIAVGLISTFTVDTSLTRMVLYQIMYGIGVGFVFQQPYTAVQTVLPEDKVPTALVTLAFAQESGGIVALSIAQNVFVQSLSHLLADLMPGMDPRDVLHRGTLGIIDQVPAALREQVLQAYGEVLAHVFHLALVFVCLTMVGALGIEWKSVKEGAEEDGANERLIT